MKVLSKAVTVFRMLYAGGLSLSHWSNPGRRVQVEESTAISRDTCLLLTHGKMGALHPPRNSGEGRYSKLLQGSLRPFAAGYENTI